MATTRNQIIKDLKKKKFKVGSGGFVRLVDVMGDDSAIVQAARVSYGAGTKSVSDDTTLIRYLMRHRHSTPFEMCELKFHVRVPMDTWRQWIRHRTANVNEYSTRYSEAIDENAVTPPGEWRLQSGTNKQGSSGNLQEWPEGWRTEDNDDADPEVGAGASCNVIYEAPGLKMVYHKEGPAGMTPGEFLSNDEESLHSHARTVYKKRLSMGVAREQARKDLPLSTYTEAYWKIDLHNLLHFLSLRMDSHAQKEIRDYAQVISQQIVSHLFPISCAAFVDYRLNAMQLTALDIEMMRRLNAQEDGASHAHFEHECEFYPFHTYNWNKEKCRERDECRDKLVRLGILPSID